MCAVGRAVAVHMDATTRRYLYDLIATNAVQRTILFCIHFGGTRLLS